MSELLQQMDAGSGRKSNESRFGDVEQILEAMNQGDAEMMGSIETIITDINPHANEVDVVDVDIEQTDQVIEHANEVDWVIVRDGQNNALRCVFKPFDGERHEPDARSGEEFNVKKFYTHEYAAFLISQHFGFDLVPPTVIREVDGRVGSLQLFVNPEKYKPYSKMEDMAFSDMYGEDWNNMAAFDWLLANCERHTDNFLVNLQQHDQLVGIDHGVCLSTGDYWGLEFRGPSLNLTFDNLNNKPKAVDIPEETLEKLRDGLARRAELESALKQEGLDIEDEEINRMFERAQQLLNSGKFLSKSNCREVADYNCFA